MFMINLKLCCTKRERLDKDKLQNTLRKKKNELALGQLQGILGAWPIPHQYWPSKGYVLNINLIFFFLAEPWMNFKCKYKLFLLILGTIYFLTFEFYVFLSLIFKLLAVQINIFLSPCNIMMWILVWLLFMRSQTTLAGELCGPILLMGKVNALFLGLSLVISMLFCSSWV